MDGDIRLAEAIAEAGRSKAVGGKTQDAPVVLADGRRFLTALGDDEFTFRSEAEGAGEFTHVGRLREGVGEEVMDVGLAVAVRIAEAPDAVAVEDEDLVVAEGAGHRLMQAGGEAAPGDVGRADLQAAGQPDIAVERDDDRGAVLAELDVARADSAFPGIVDRQGDMIDGVGFGASGHVNFGLHLGLPATGRGTGRDGPRGHRGRGVLVGERDAEGGGRGVGRHLHHEEIIVGGEFSRAGDGDAGLEFLRRALAARADDEQEVLGVGRDGEVAFDDDVAGALAGFPEFADGGVGDAIGQDDVLADEFDGLESPERRRDRTAADFRGRRGGRARVGAVDRGAELPTGDDGVAEPELAFGLRRGELAAERLAAGVVIGTRREGLIADALAAPDRRDTEQVGVEAGPGIVREFDDQPAGREVVLAGSFATGVEDRGEEREIGLDPAAPGLRRVGLRLTAFARRRFFYRLGREGAQRT